MCVPCKTLLWINLVYPRLVACSWQHAAYSKHYTFAYVHTLDPYGDLLFIQAHIRPFAELQIAANNKLN